MPPMLFNFSTISTTIFPGTLEGSLTVTKPYPLFVKLSASFRTPLKP
ncbi:hypothetical protein CPAR01_12530 [Colletotrichum paranaense]|uniref:Uncharacterized protein n=1 Tax=Colletotrichum paranaense TaxID=1914294 RepID=A0ABQ9S6R6_9PEZI|nr:uncharacterized protein CPAR01_12530 [Colletotrichum paranaense]KAK1527972.1 hypothetical protein CPAR01_12530 [Colletotrichum paranaense]